MPARVQCGLPGKACTTTGRAAPSESGALGWLKGPATTCATWMSHPSFVSGACIRRHVLDPRKRKSSITRRPLEARFSCSRWSIFSMMGSRPAWRSTVSCPLIPRALPGAGCDFQVPGMPEHPGTGPGPVSLSETAGLAVCGETGRAGSLSGPVVAIRSGPTIPPVRSAVRGGDSGAGAAPRSAGEPAYPM